MAKRRKKRQKKEEPVKSVEPVNALYKVTLSTDIMVVSDNEENAIAIGNLYSKEEGVHAIALSASVINSISDIPRDWSNIFPYYDKEKIVVTKRCSDFAKELNLPTEAPLIVPEEPVVTSDPTPTEKPVEIEKPIEELIEKPVQQDTLPILQFDIPPKPSKA